MNMKNLVSRPEIYLPAADADFTKWAVIACDQFTSEPEYWEKLEREIGDAPSALRLILPEVYLSDHQRLNKISVRMEAYVKDEILQNRGKGFVLLERTTAYGRKRLGLVIAVDLEQYSYAVGATCPIRATEKTVVERIPARVKIRENALLELPHVMLLMDDKEERILQKALEKKDYYEKIYDFDLNGDGGHLKGYFIQDTAEIESDLDALANPSVLTKKYGTDKDPVIFVVGDGNHSLAAAKAHWEKVKSGLTEAEQALHPARYAMVEVESLYDDGLEFEPIHRLLFHVDVEDFCQEWAKHVTGNSTVQMMDSTGKKFRMAAPEKAFEALEQIQRFLDEYLKEHAGTELDYVHGTDSLERLVAAEENRLAIFMPRFGKEELFGFIRSNGSLPRKSFSMGEATEKRYYVEARRIK